MKKRNIIFLALAGIICASAAHSGEGPSSALSSLIDTASERNQEIKAAREKWASMVSLVRPSGSLPDLTIGAAWENIPPGHYSLGDARMEMLSVSQRYPFLGKRSLMKDIAGKESAVYRLKYEQVKLEVISELKKEYYQYFYLQKIIEILQEEEEILKQFSSVAEQSYRLGREKQINVLKAQVEMAKINNEIITRQNNKITSQARINALLDYPSGRSIGYVEEPAYVDIVLTPEEIGGIVAANNPFLKELALRKEQAGKKISLAGKGYLPDLNLAYKHRRIDDEYSGWDLGVSLNVPLYFRKQRGIIRSARQEQDSIDSVYAHAVNQIDFMVTSILTEIDTHNRLYRLFQTNFLPKALQAKETAQTAYKSGQALFIDWLDSERSYLDFQIEYWEHFRDYLKGLADLEQIMAANIEDITKETK